MAEVVQQPIHHFSDDVLIEIFSRLPVRSLFLFRSVCKHWLSLIQNPYFINLHNKSTINNNSNTYEPMLILRTVGSETQPITEKIVLTFLSDDENETLAYNYDVALEVLSPSMASRGRMHLIGPCNGLFCMTDRVDFVLFNPATRQCRNFTPNCNYYSKPNVRFDCVSFGFDPVRNDYMVVGFSILRHLKVEIFSLSTSCWRVLDSIVSPFCINSIRCFGFSFNGAFHWLSVLDNICSILVFDLNKEAFSSFHLPDGYFGNDVWNCYLSVLNESLALLVHSKLNNFDSNGELQVWVMKEYGVNRSWIKLYDIEFGLGIERPLSFSEKGEFLVVNDKGQLVSYNFETRAIKEFEVHGVPRSFHAFRYRESLVSLK